jgi:effector-binding domain-containing protein
MLIGKIQKQASEAFFFLFAEAETDYPGIAASGGKIMDEINAYVKGKGVNPKGPVIWMYDHIGSGKVKLKAGLPIPEGVQGNENLKIEFKPEWNHVSTIYIGSMENIGKAWDQFTEEASRLGFTPMNINREVYKKWVAFDSKENITELQVGVKETITPNG